MVCEHAFVMGTGAKLSEIARRIVYLEYRERARLSELIELVGEFDAREGARGSRFRGTAEWLAFECGMEPRTARDHVRVARRLREWQRVAEAFGEGRLSYSQVRALARASEGEDEAALLRVALTATVRELEMHVRQLRSAPSADLDVANEAHARRGLTWFWAEDGSLRFFGKLGAPDGAALVEAVETAAAAMHAGDDACSQRKRPPLRARRADALAELACGGGPRTHLVLHADVAALACMARDGEPPAGDVCALRDGPAIPSALARRLTCDADVSVAGLDLGRTQRTISPSQRRALEARDGRVCAMPGCDRTHGLDGHHICHWSRGGRTDLENLVLLCRFHHRLFHDDGFTMRRRRDGQLVMQDACGRRLDRVPSRASPALVAA